MPSLAETHPALADQWVTTDDGKTPHDVTAGSAYRATWRCTQCGHTWTAVTYSRARGTGCPQCKRAVISANRSRPRPGESLSDKYPHIAAEWDHERNDLKPQQVAAHGRLNAHWVCSDCDNQWQAAVCNRTRDGKGSGCPACFARRHSRHMRLHVGGLSIATAFPDIAGQWDFTASENQGATPATTKAKSGIKRAWACDCGHRWVSTPASRSLGYGCARCQQRRGSTQEEAVRAALVHLDSHAGSGVVPRRDGKRTRAWSVDALSQTLRLIVEFDGSYWHGPSVNPGALRRDQAKTTDLASQGWLVIRVREAPLEPVTEHDLTIPLGANGEALTALVLDHLTAVLERSERPILNVAT